MQELTLKEIEIMYDMIDKFGEKQMIIAVEELSELQKEICKKLRDPYSIDNKNILEEIADVYIMLTQITIFYQLKANDITAIMKEKLERTKRLYLNNSNSSKDKEQLKK
ncbi:MAG: hypothetical protein IKT40_03265 [Bacilli bacterium]|nr:hypothetical protein [Bacilli bacterium]